MITGWCHLCGSEIRAGRKCEESTCRGLSDEQLAVDRAGEDYSLDRIDVDELERRLEIALTNPPRASRLTTIRR